MWLIHKNLSGAITQSQSWPVNDGNKRVLHIPQSSNITKVSPSDLLMTYPGHLLGEFYTTAEMQYILQPKPTGPNKVFTTNLQDLTLTIRKYSLSYTGPLFCGGVIPLCIEYSQYILSRVIVWLIHLGKIFLWIIELSDFFI